MNHVLSSMTTLVVGTGRDKENVRMTVRQVHLRLSRVPGACHVCGDTGIYRLGELAPVYDETYGGPDGRPSERQIAEREAYVRTYCPPVPCFNPACTAPKPANACPACDGIGQEVVNGELTDIVCKACSGFGTVRSVAMREAA